MSLKIAAENWQKPSSKKVEEAVIEIRSYDEEKHKVGVEKLERLCEVGQRGKPSLVTDLLGDPICRIRHFQLHVMLVITISYLIILITVFHFLEFLFYFLKLIEKEKLL